MAADVLAAAPDCIKLLSSSGQIRYINEQGLRMLEADSIDEVIGQSYVGLWPEPLRHQLREAVHGAAAGGHAAVEGLRYTLKRTPRWWEVHFHGLRNLSAEREIICIARDITERHEREVAALEESTRVAAALVESERSKATFIATLSVALPPQAVTVNGDEVRLVRVVTNLLLNAGKFTAQHGRLSIVISLPLATAATAAAERVLGERQADGAIPAVARRVLLVDDNVDAASTRSTLLEWSRHEVRVVHSGAEALALVAEFRPEIVILDIGMSGMNGYEVAKAIRAMPGGSAYILVALTGWGSVNDRERARAAGFDEHLTKPVDVARIEAILVRV